MWLVRSASTHSMLGWVMSGPGHLVMTISDLRTFWMNNSLLLAVLVTQIYGVQTSANTGKIYWFCVGHFHIRRTMWAVIVSNTNWTPTPSKLVVITASSNNIVNESFWCWVDVQNSMHWALNRLQPVQCSMLSAEQTWWSSPPKNNA